MMLLDLLLTRPRRQSTQMHVTLSKTANWTRLLSYPWRVALEQEETAMNVETCCIVGIASELLIQSTLADFGKLTTFITRLRASGGYLRIPGFLIRLHYQHKTVRQR